MFDDHIHDLIHYKNCYFQGNIIDSLKQNTGITVLDTGEIIIGNFKNDQLHGDCLIFINPQAYAIGTFTRGLLDGNFVLRNPKMSFYWTVKMNKIQGEIAVINYQTMIARLWHIQNGQGFCSKQIDISQLDKQQQILYKISPYTQLLPSSLTFLQQKFQKFLQFQVSSVNQSTFVSIPVRRFYKIKVLFFKDRIIQYGIYSNNQLNGLGYSIEAGCILQGNFKNGKLDGYGLKIQTQIQKNIYGTFKSGDIRTIDIVTDDEKIAKKQLKQQKKSYHIHSLQFQNNYFNQRPVLMLQNLLKTIQTNEQNFTKQLQYQQELSSKHQRTFQKTKDAWIVNQSANLGTNRKQRSFNNTMKSQEIENLNNQKLKSRFKPNPNAGYIDKSNQSQIKKQSQFSEGIKQLNMINKALRKFK